MTKSILFNVASTQLINILNGTQTTLLTKRLPKDFVGWVYLYCTKGKPYLFDCIDFHKEILEKLEPNHKRPRFITELFDLRIPLMWERNNKIVARFWWDGNISGLSNKTKFRYYKNLETSQVIKEEIFYAIPITKLEIFDIPMELGWFYKSDKFDGLHFPVPLTKAPQSWGYAWGRE